MIFFYGAPLLIFLEIAAFIVIGSKIGILSTMGLLILSAILGSIIVQHQGLGILARVRQSLDRGLLPVDDLFDGLCLLIAGSLLILPGFVSDLVGFALLIPAVRQAIRGVLMNRYDVKEGAVTPDNGVIEGEFVRIREEPGRIVPPANDP